MLRESLGLPSHIEDATPPYQESLLHRLRGKVAIMGVMPSLIASVPVADCGETSISLRQQLTREMGIEIDRLPEERFLTIASYNVAAGLKGNVREAILQNPSDILCLQEATRPLMVELAEATSMVPVSGWTALKNDEAYGNVILSQRPVLKYSTYNLRTKPGRQNRNLTTATLVHNGEELVVATTHLINKEPGPFGSRRKQERREQVLDILRILNGQDFQDKRVLFCGDLNTLPGSEEYNMLMYLFDETVASMGRPCIVTFPYDRSQKDYIWFEREDFLPVDLKVWGGSASDHKGLGVTFLERELPAR